MNLRMLLSECQWAWMISAPSAPKALYSEHAVSHTHSSVPTGAKQPSVTNLLEEALDGAIG